MLGGLNSASSNQQSSRAQGEKQASNRDTGNVSAPLVVSLPEREGVIMGMGEKFTSNPVRSTVSLTVPIYVSLDRSSFATRSLSNDLESRNGPIKVG